MLVIGMVLVVVGLVAATMAVTIGARETTGVARSLELVMGTVTTQEAASAELGAYDRLLAPVLGRTRGLAERLSPKGTHARLARSLDRAGNPRGWGVERVLAFKGLALLVGAGVGLLVGGLSLLGLGYAVALGAACFYLPDLLVYNAAVKRRDELTRGLADALDMLTVCVEAGQGFDAAMLQVARAVDGPIAGEFARVLTEVQLGRDRATAFAGMAERTSSPPVRAFISALVQADRLGLPVAAVLREQSTQLRLVRQQIAEEKAQKVTVKILFPLLFCIFPALFIIIIGPGAIRMMSVFSGM